MEKSQCEIMGMKGKGGYDWTDKLLPSVTIPSSGVLSLVFNEQMSLCVGI